MEVKYTVFMESEEYGYEEFASHSTIEDALESVGRLVADVTHYFKTDGIERKVGIIIRKED